MPYAIRLPDGTLVQNIPDDLPPEQAKQRIIAAGLVKAPETTALGQVKEGFKGLVPGAVGLVESAAIGASALLPEDYEKTAREKIASVAGAAKAPFAAAPGYEETVGRKLGEAVGSTAPFLLMGPLGVPGRAAMLGLGVGAGAGEARTRAEREGATAEERSKATLLGTGPGALEVFAPFRILSRVPDAAKAQGVQLIKRAALAGGEEAAQEAASGFAQNLIAKGIYKPEQELIEGLGEQAAYGGATGAIVQGLMDLALGRRARAAQPAPGTLPDEKPIERAERLKAEAEAAKTAGQLPAGGIPPLPDTYSDLVLYSEQLKALPKSKERDAALKAAAEKRKALIVSDVGAQRSATEAAKQFMTAEEAAAAQITSREEVTAPPEGQAPAPEGQAPAPIEEPKVRKPGEPPAGGLQPADIEGLGISKKQPIYQRMLGKDLEDPEQRTAVLADIENYLTRGNGTEESRTKLTEFKAKFAPPPEVETPTTPAAEAAPVAPPPEVETPAAPPVEAPVGGAPVVEAVPPVQPEMPSVAEPQSEAGRASVPVAVEPAAVSPTEGVGVEPTGVVSPVEDVEQPVGGKGTEPVAVTPAPTPAQPAAPTPAQIERELTSLVESGRITEEQAADYRTELLGEAEEAPTTAMGQAFQKQADDIRAQMDALRQKSGKKPALKSKNRAKFDELEAQLNALSPVETGTLKEKLEKAEATGVFTVRDGEPILDIPAVRTALKGRDPKMLKAVLTYIGVDEDGDYLPTTYSADEAAQSVGLAKSSGANVRRIAETLGITADVVSRFQASQTGAIGIAKNVSEASLSGMPVEMPKTGILYEAPAKPVQTDAEYDALVARVKELQVDGKAPEKGSPNSKGYKEAEKALKQATPKVQAFFRPALTKTGSFDFTKLDTRQLADIYSRASRYDAKDNTEVMEKLGAEVEARRKVDKTGTNAAINRAYGKLVTEEEAQAETEAEPTAEEGAEEVEADDKTRRLSDEDVEYRSIPQSPLVQNRASHTELEKVVADIEEALGGKVAVTILDDVTDVDAKQKPGSRAGAVIKGEIYLFRSGIAKGIEGQKTIFHELFHKGLKKLLPEAEYRALMNKFYNQSADIRAMADAYLASDVGKQDAKGLNQQDARALAVEESLAEVAEQTDIKPTLVRQIGSFLANVADRIGMTQLARAIRTMGLNEQEKFVRDAIQAGLGVTEGGGATRFREIEKIPPTPFGQFGPIKNASVRYFSNGASGVFAQVLDQDLIDSGVKPSRAVVDQFDLDISKDGKVAEIHTFGVSPAASAVLSKYKGQISRVKRVGYSGDPYYKFDPGSFSNKELRELIRSLRDISIREGSFGKVETVKIKRATGATAGSAPREISREAAMRFRSITPQTEAAVQGVDVIGEKDRQTLTQRIAQDLKDNPALKLRMKFTDSLAPLEEFFVNAYGGATRTGAGRLNPMVLLSRALDALRISKAAQEQGGLGFDNGLIVAKELKNAEGKSISYVGVLNRIAEAAKKRGETYESFRTKIDTVLYGHREHGLREANKTLPKSDQLELLLPDAKIDELEAAFQQDDFIKEVLADLDTIRFNLLDTLVDAGRISKEQAKDYKDATGYIPFNRLGDYEKVYQSTRGANRGAAALRNIRRLEGSTRKTTSPIENFSGLVDWATKEATKNHAALSALKDMALMGAAVKRSNKPTKDAPGDIVRVYDGGKPVEFYVPDPAHFVAFSIADPQLSSVLKAMQRGSQVLRAGVTAMPPFAIKQVFDDIVRAYTYAGVKNNAALVKNILTNFPKNWFNEVFKRKPQSIRELESLGIVGTFDFTQQGNLKNILEEAGAKKEGLGSTIVRVMEAGAKASDLAVREAIYKQVLKETNGDKAQAESAAREIINFSRRGSSKMMGQMISVIPFFNAYARGMDKLATAAAGGVVGRSTGTARSMFYNRMAVMTAMGFAYALMMQDDEEYNKLPDHVRDTNWILPHGKDLGFTPAIPVPAELAFFFKAIPERVVRYYKLQGTPEEQAAVSVLGEMTKRGIDVFSSPNVTPQVLRPLFENMVNHSWFLGRPLESQSQLALRPFERYGTGTSDAMKSIANGLEDAANATGIEAFAISPIKLENAVRGLLGTGAGVMLSMADMVVNPTRTDRPMHQQMAAQLSGAGALMKNPIGTRYMDEIYNLEKRVEQVNNTLNRLMKTSPERVDEFIRDNIGLYSIREPLNAVMNSIRVLNDAAMTINRDTSMSSAERREQMNYLQMEQNEIARIVFSLRKMAVDTQKGL